MTYIPKIISVDDHVVEPAHLWETWLPGEVTRTVGRSVVRRGDLAHRGAGPGEVQGDTRRRAPRTSATSGSTTTSLLPQAHGGRRGDPVEEWTMAPITFEDIRTACYDPKARLDDMEMNHVEASLCFPELPPLLRADLLGGQGQGTGPRCVQAYNDWMVEEWCGDTGGRLVPLWSCRCGMPSWLRPKCGATPHAGCGPWLHRAADLPRPAVDLLRLLGSVPPGVRRDGLGHRMHIGSSSHDAAPRPTRRRR